MATKSAFKGRSINLLRASPTRMAGHFYAMHRAMILSKCLLGIVFSPKWEEFLQGRDKKSRQVIVRAGEDVQNPRFFKAIWVLLRSLWPALKILRNCDKSEPQMDKLYYYIHKGREALKKSAQALDDPDLFDTHATVSNDLISDTTFSDDNDEGSDSEDEEESLGEEEDNETEDESENEEDSGEEGGGGEGGGDDEVGDLALLSNQMLKAYNHRVKKMEHDYAIVGEKTALVNFFTYITNLLLSPLTPTRLDVFCPPRRHG